MSFRHLAALLIAATACAPAAGSGPAGTLAADPAPVAFVGVHVLPMTGETVLQDHTVVVRGDRITAVGPRGEVEVPEGATRVEGQGRYLLPGLAEMHGHIPNPNAPEQYTRDVLLLYVAHGITTVRGMLGWPGQLELREQTASGEVLGPTLYLAGPSFNGNSIDSPEQAVEKVRQQTEEGWDLLKVHPGLTREEYDAMARTAHEVGIRFGGHVPADVGLLHALESRQETFDHLDGYVEYLGDGALDQEKLADVVEKTREAGAWVVPTMALWETLLGVSDPEALDEYPELRYMPDDQVDQWRRAAQSRRRDADSQMETRRRIADHRKVVLKALSDGGVPVLMGTDAPQIYSVPGASLRHELRLMAEAGMTPYEILVSGTRNVGEYFEEQDSFGTVAAGQRADLLLVRANPLADLDNVFDRAGVMVRGRWLDAEEIQRRLDEVAAR